MSSRYTPKRILKKQLSQQEHSLMEDWAPGNLNEHHNIETDAPVLAKHQAPSSKLVKQGGYTAPNGTHLSDHELAELSHGIENSESKCVTYFQPCFIEDPWMGLPSMKMEFTTRYW
ncbi:hypothetical protein BDV38DRAFT_279507 [Aspergillus pseudotamarii]|uniref:Uncharacterized protein n=1 Tax=Aspergillus pseudotamarii TaxID=132259 RepID=A0A5N6T420_ASPPS|nr:uncharacterized protein BDV38DRAFT_279507 [Aspergillus pseudotamarii]KAE8141058.1 hypothetical protein BDV38DRAFT_279507 [Aspergillus pseudotamarii]